MEHLPPTLSERPTMRYRPEPSVVPANDSDPPVAPGRKVGPVLALIGAVAFGVTVAMVVAPKLAVVVSPEAAVASSSSPVGTAPAAAEAEEPAAPARGAVQASPAGVSARADREADEASDAIDGIDVPPPPEGPTPDAAPALLASSRPHRERRAESRSRRRRSGRGLQRVASGARAIDAPEVGDHAIGRAQVAGEARPRRDLDASMVRRAIEPQHARMRACYQRAVRQTGQPRSVRMTVTVDVDPEGHVNTSQVSGPDFGGLSHCLWRVSVRWRFPASISGGRVPVPVSFSARDE